MEILSESHGISSEKMSAAPSRRVQGQGGHFVHHLDLRWDMGHGASFLGLVNKPNMFYGTTMEKYWKELPEKEKTKQVENLGSNRV